MKKSRNYLNSIILILGSILICILFIYGILKETATIYKWIEFMITGFLLSFFILKCINEMKTKEIKALNVLAESFQISAVIAIYFLLENMIIKNIWILIFISTLCILLILGIIFNCLNKKIIWKTFFTIIILSNILLLPIVLNKTNMDPFYLLLIGNCSIDISLIFYYLSNNKKDKTCYYILFVIGIILTNYYIIKYTI